LVSNFERLEEKADGKKKAERSLGKKESVESISKARKRIRKNTHIKWTLELRTV
jgi:hypothetical protein